MGTLRLNGSMVQVAILTRGPRASRINLSTNAQVLRRALSRERSMRTP